MMMVCTSYYQAHSDKSVASVRVHKVKMKTESLHECDLDLVIDIRLCCINTPANYAVETGSKTGWTMPRRAICSKISVNKMPSGFCGSNFIVSET